MNFSNGYSLLEIMRLSYSYFVTKVFFKGCRIIRQPLYIRNKNLIYFGENFTSGRHCRIDAFSHIDNSVKVEFGKNCQINDNVHIASMSKVTFGDDVLVASRVYISDHNHGSYSGIEHSAPTEIANKRLVKAVPVSIGNNVWVGEGVAILPGVSIGNNSIIGANSVVTKSFGCDLILAGNPARVIKRYCKDSLKWISVKDV